MTKYTQLKLCNLNVRGIGDIKKRRKLFNYLKQVNYDIVTLQEVHSVVEEEELWRKQWHSDIFFSHGSSQARGVCTMIQEGMGIDAKAKEKDSDGRLLVTEIEYQGLHLDLYNIYVPNEDDISYFETIGDIANNSDLAEKIIVGDFNCTLRNNIDRKGSDYNHVKVSSFLNNIMEEQSLCDPWCIRNPDLQEFTWCRAKPCPHFVRLDYYLCTDSLYSRIDDMSHRHGFSSDHSIVEMILNRLTCSRERFLEI